MPKDDSCSELKTLQYKTMLLNQTKMKDDTICDTSINVEDLLQKESQMSKVEPWNKLDKTTKVKKLEKYADKLKDDNYSLYENNRILVTSNKLFQFINLFSSEFYDSEANSYNLKISLRNHKRIPKVITKNIILANWREDGLGCNKELEIFEEYDKIKRDNKISSKNVTF